MATTLAPRAPFDAKKAAAAMDAKLLPFQKEGVEFGKKVEGRVLIADEMGCGKSAQAIRLCLEYADEAPVLIVCPASLRYTWAHEIEKWLPALAPSEVPSRRVERIARPSREKASVCDRDLLALHGELPSCKCGETTETPSRCGRRVPFVAHAGLAAHETITADHEECFSVATAVGHAGARKTGRALRPGPRSR